MTERQTIGWERLWRDESVAKRWAEMPPLPEVVRMADILEAEGRKRVLDIGCGMGRHTLYLAARGFEVTAIDNAPTAIEACKRSLKEGGLRATLIECDMGEFPFEDNFFDGAISARVIHHAKLATIRRIVDKITRVLSPGGIFVWITPSRRSVGDGSGVSGEEIEPGTWIHAGHREGDIPHHYCAEEEARELLDLFDIKSMYESEHEKDGRIHCHWRVVARKKQAA